jgi:hypothetical protein
MAENKRMRKVLLASTLSLLIVACGWLFVSEQSPFYWYLIAHGSFRNLYMLLNIVPYLFGVIASGNVHGLNTGIYLVAAFAQWFVLMYFLSELIVRIPFRFTLFFIVISFSLIGIAAWVVTEGQRSSKAAQESRFKDLGFGLTKDQARRYFGAPDLEADNKTVTRYGETRPWTMYHAFYNPSQSEQIERLTAVRWIYFHRGPNTFHEAEDRSQGLPSKWNTEIGFDYEGKVLWFNRISGTTAPEIDAAKLK